MNISIETEIMLIVLLRFTRFLRAQAAFYRGRVRRNQWLLSEKDLDLLHQEYRSAAYEAMGAGLITDREYREIMLLYPDVITKVGLENFAPNLAHWIKLLGQYQETEPIEE